jgi:hypothetical protein
MRELCSQNKHSKKEGSELKELEKYNNSKRIDLIDYKNYYKF